MKRISWLLCMLCFLAACERSSEPDYFSLAPVSGTPAPAIAVSIKVYRPVVAGYLDRPDFVRQDGAYRLFIDDADRWVEPLDQMSGRILAADLQQRLPDSTVLTEGDTASITKPRFSIDLDIHRFNQTEAGTVVLEGKLMISDQNTHAVPQLSFFHLTQEVGASPDSVAAGLSQLLAGTADLAAQNIITFQKQEMSQQVP